MQRENRGSSKGLDQLKNWFKGTKKSNLSRSKSDEYYVLTEELEGELRQTSPLATRVKVVKELFEYAENHRLDNFTLQKLWIILQDLLKAPNPKEIRSLIFTLFTKAYEGSFSPPPDTSDHLKSKLFTFIQSHEIEEDWGAKLKLLRAISREGKDLSGFGEKIGGWIGGSLGRERESGELREFNAFLVNVIKFNQTFLDASVLSGIIRSMSVMCSLSPSCRELIDSCLSVLFSIVCYPSVPPSSLSPLLITLCIGVNSSPPDSCKILRHLLGTPYGQSSLLTLLTFMEGGGGGLDEVNGEVGVLVVRGAVFFVGASLWGAKSLRSLKYSPSTVLSSFSHALDLDHPYISYEVLSRLQELIRSRGESLLSPSWDLILDIMSKIISLTHPLSSSPSVTNGEHSGRICTVLNECLDEIERIYGGLTSVLSAKRLYALIDSINSFRPKSSVEKLLEFKSSHYLTSKNSDWLPALLAFTDRHYSQECRPGIKNLALAHISRICVENIESYEEELIEKLILPSLRNLETETDVSVREGGVRFIVEFLLRGFSKKCHDLLNILEKVLNRPYELANCSETVHIFSEKDVGDCLSVVEGLIKIFTSKIYYLPSSIPISAYKILVKHLTQHYKKPSVLEECSTLRYRIFECFFSIRANATYHLGFPLPSTSTSTTTTNSTTKITPTSSYATKIKYSSYLAVDYGERDEIVVSIYGSSESLNNSYSNTTNPNSVTNSGENVTSSSGGGASSPNLNITPPVQPPTFLSQQIELTYISLSDACKIVVTSLRKEKDWRVLELILKQIPYVMENKALILSKHGNDIDYLAQALCGMMLDKNIGASFPESLKNTPPKFQKTDFHGYLYPILTALVSYHAHLEYSQQQRIVKCLEHGLVSKSAQVCIVALSTCTLEMKETMHKLLPEVLLALSKITAKVNIAIPVLEFLSTLIHLPRVFASFVQDQYMSIFAIALPYTNPFKFNQYTVSLAHHVIAMWFIKCRLSFRRGFVSYIIKGLQNNVLYPFDEEKRRVAAALETQNEDSSNRKRSSSLTESGAKRRERPISGSISSPRPPTSGSEQAPPLSSNETLLSFHSELTETCVDLMARYAFSNSSPLPTRFPSTSFLLRSSAPSTWILDSKLISITTSGCTGKELRNGLCDKCWTVCGDGKGLSGGERRGLIGGGFEGKSLIGGGGVEGRSLIGGGGVEGRSLIGGGGVDGKNLIGGGGVEGRGVIGVGGEGRSLIGGGGEGRGLIGGGGEGGRRRHHSELAAHGKEGRGSGGEERVKSKDDTGLENRIGGGKEGDSGIKSDESSLCGCWCQGWAEIHIRRPTGNTSWMMRIQNSIGGNFPGSGEYSESLRELSSIFLQNTRLSSSPDLISLSSSGLTPHHFPFSTGQGGETSGGEEGRGVSLKGKETTKTKSPISPSRDKSLVQRCNSSPEMSEGGGGGGGRLNFPSQIQELDEEEPKISTDGPRKSNTLTGSISPYRGSYEAIPEESLSGSGGRERVNTVSVMSGRNSNSSSSNVPLRRIASVSGDTPTSTKFKTQFSSHTNSSEGSVQSGMSPSFVFLQLCHQGMFGKDPKPILVPPSHENGIRVLDYIQPFETHKIGVLYIGRGQSKDEGGILQNNYGSLRYRTFLRGLGRLIRLRDVDRTQVFIGGLSQNGDDGEFAYIWQDDVMQVIFHVATLMPNKESDPQGVAKKRHVGNDFVAIVYNNSQEDYDINTFKGQFLYACIVVEPLDHGTNRIILKAKSPLSEHIGNTEPKIVSDSNLPTMARQLALHSNLASEIINRKGQDPYASNWLERLRKIKLLRAKCSAADTNSNNGGDKDKKQFNVVDFTDFV